MNFYQLAWPQLETQLDQNSACLIFFLQLECAVSPPASHHPRFNIWPDTLDWNVQCPPPFLLCKHLSILCGVPTLVWTSDWIVPINYNVRCCSQYDKKCPFCFANLPKKKGSAKKMDYTTTKPTKNPLKLSSQIFYFWNFVKEISPQKVM